MSKLRVALALGLLLPATSWAQVGHDPAHSPYRDVRNRTSLVFIGSAVRGSSGLLEIGPGSGLTYGGRFEMRLTGPTDAFLGISTGSFARLVIDPDAPLAERVSGPVDQSVTFVDAGMSILLTGDKTWYNLAPYLGAALGLGFGRAVRTDSSGFRFNAKFLTGPHVGIRYYATRSISFRAEGRLLFWRLKYPMLYFSDPFRAPGQAPVLDANTQSDSEWTAHPVLVLAVGYSLRL